MYALIKSYLFSKQPEEAHYWVMKNLKRVSKLPFATYFIQQYFRSERNNQNVNVLGLSFKNKVGLAAGFDKNAEYIEELALLGFGHIEIGTVTPKPQPGNDLPRLFRLVEDEALINRMGFNNKGVDYVVEQLKNTKRKDLIIGGNIGKNKTTPNENAINDYLICFEKLFDHVDYFVVNVSSPNTPGLRELQEKEPLLNILQTLQTKNNLHQNPKPILLKIAPDLSENQLNDIIEIVNTSKIAGIIATNTTITRNDLKSDPKLQQEMGGLSGKPVREKSTEVIKYLKPRLNKNTVIVGVGGIFSAKDAQEKFDAGAELVQIYSGFIYQGPMIINEIKKV